MERIDKVVGTFDRKASEIKATIPDAVKKRLPRYHRYLGDLIREGRGRISSKELAEIMNVTASQIRQDLNCFGGFGQQGYGYNIKYLYGKIGELLGIEEGYKAIIVGAGNLGKALAASHMFERRGVKRLAMFDSDEKIIGTTIYGLPVYDVKDLYDFCKREGVDIGVLTVPKTVAYEVALTMSDAGVRGIWNFANMELSLPGKEAIVENIHLGDSLLALCYEMKTQSEEKED